MRLKYLPLANLLVFLAFLGISICISWPLAQAPGKYFVGGYFYESHVFLVDLVIRGFQENLNIITSTHEINFPEGGSLTIVGWSYIIPTFIMKLLGLNLIAAINIILLLHLAGGGFLTYLLAWRLTGRRPESVVGGLAFGFCPFVIIMLFNGQIEKLSHGFLPLCVLLLLEVVVSKRTWMAILLGLTFGLATASDPYTAICCAGILVLTSAYLVVQSGSDYQQKLRPIALCALSCLVAVLPFLFYWIYSHNVPGYEALLKPARGPLFSKNAAKHSSTLAGWFVLNRPGPGSAGLFISQSGHYLGWMLMLVTGLSFGAARWLYKKFAAWPAGAKKQLSDFYNQDLKPAYFLMVAFIFFILASGYFLFPSESRLTFFSYRVSLPLYWLDRLLPISDYFYVTKRAAIVVAWCLALLAAIGLSRLGMLIRAEFRYALCLLSGVLILTEFFSITSIQSSSVTRTINIPEVYEDLKATNDRGAVIEVPALYAQWNAPYLFYYTIHHHPMAMRERLHFNKSDLPEAQLISLIYREMGSDVFAIDAEYLRGLFVEVDPHRIPELILTPYCYLILHEGQVRAGMRPRIRKFFDESFELVRAYPKDLIRLYRVSKGPPPPTLDPEQPSAKRTRFYLDPRWSAACGKP